MEVRPVLFTWGPAGPSVKGRPGRALLRSRVGQTHPVTCEPAPQARVPAPGLHGWSGAHDFICGTRCRSRRLQASPPQGTSARLLSASDEAKCSFLNLVGPNALSAPSPSAARIASEPTMAAKTPIPQNDNVAHALAGAGGGILSMVLTYAIDTSSLALLAIPPR